MRIDDFGPLGLPLSPGEAKRLIGLCTQAPFGKNERTIVNKEVRDTWELGPDKVRCHQLDRLLSTQVHVTDSFRKSTLATVG